MCRIGNGLNQEEETKPKHMLHQKNKTTKNNSKQKQNKQKQTKEATKTTWTGI